MIDSHHHFWRYDPVQYAWITDDMALLKRDFLPEHLIATVASLGVTGVVSVQAEQTRAETERLLAYADQNDFIKGVVGWAPLTPSDLDQVLTTTSAHPKLKGIRHVLQDEPDPEYMLRPDFNRGIAALKPHGLVYDILIYERHLPQSIQFVDKHPEQPFVLDHLGKPNVASGSSPSWHSSIRELARRPNVSCKISGLVTEADHRHWTDEELQPYLETVLDAFGPKRLMFGSDWPVCLLAASYERWLGVVHTLLSRLSESERERVLRGTATEVYRLSS